MPLARIMHIRAENFPPLPCCSSSVYKPIQSHIEPSIKPAGGDAIPIRVLDNKAVNQKPTGLMLLLNTLKNGDPKKTKSMEKIIPMLVSLKICILETVFFTDLIQLLLQLPLLCEPVLLLLFLSLY